MKTDVEVTVTGLPFNQKGISGVSITYPFNDIPTAAVQLVVPYIEENAPQFLCNPDQFKKQTRDSPVTIKLKSKTGCINFKGVFDGMSFTQTPGGLSYSAIIKSEFQVMRELYPKFVGIDPTSILPFKRVTGLKIQNGNVGEPYESFRSPLEKVPAAGKTLVEYYIELIKSLVRAQRQAKLMSNTTQDLAPILKLLDEDRYKRAIDKAIRFLNSIDLQYVQKIEVKAARCVNYLVNRVIYSEDTLWDTLVAGLDEMGCMLLPGNEKLMIIPKANFMKMQGLSVPNYQEQALAPNHAHPADYTSMSINDVAYRNIRSCFVVPMITDATPTMHSFRTQALGAYPDPGSDDIPDDGSTGIHIVNAPTFIIQNLDGLYVKNDKVQADLKTGEKSYADTVVDRPEDPQKSIKDHIKEYDDQIKPLKEVLNKYAKSRFLQEKYAERGGTALMSVFKPNWVPGTTGFLYSRRPGLFYNFFVTSVTHSVMLGGGNVGSSTTQINFNSCRYAGSAGNIPGTDEADLYKFTPSDMASVQQSWLIDVSGAAAANRVN